MSTVRIVPAAPGELGLPYDSWRVGQREMVQELYDQFSGGKRVVVLNSPTGSGKSLLAVAVQQMLAVEGVVLTSTINLMDQYLRDHPAIMGSKGLSNYRCHIDPARWTVNTAPCRTDKYACPFRSTAMCSYDREQQHTRTAKLVVTNYVKYLTDVKYSSGSPLRHRPLLVCDEGHRAAEHVAKFVGWEINLSNLQQLLGAHYIHPPVQAKLLSWEMWKEWLASVAKQLYREYTNSRKAVAKQLKEHYDHVNAACTALVAGWAVELQRTGDSLTAVGKPVHTGGYVQTALFTGVPSILMMSATILGDDTTFNSLGLDKQNAVYLEMPSSFPIEHRRLYIVNAGKMGRDHWQKNIDHVVQAMDKVIAHYPNQKGIVHCHTYTLQRELLARSAHRARLLPHANNDRADIAKQFQQSPDPLVLLTPSFKEGLDVPGQVRFQCLAKIPFADRSDPRVQAMCDMDTDWYYKDAITSLIQTYGRGNRTYSDQCAHYVLDSDFEILWHQASQLFPRYMKEAITPQRM